MAAAAVETAADTGVPLRFRPRPLHDKGYDTAESVAMLESWIAARKEEWSDEERTWAARAAARFLRAHRGDQEAAQANLTDTVEWRRTAIKPDSWGGRYTEDDHRFCFIPLGLDKAKRPVVYGCPARASEDDIEATVDHVVMDLEYAFANEAAEREVSRCDEQWVWLVDFTGFGLKHAMNPSLGRRFVSVFDRHCPERLGCLVLLDPPFVFSMLLGALKPFLDTATSAKIVVVSTASLETDLAHVFPPDMIGWVQEALAMPGVPGSLPLPLPSSAYWSHPE